MVGPGAGVVSFGLCSLIHISIYQSCPLHGAFEKINGFVLVLCTVLGALSRLILLMLK